jgi:PAS domain S-box-containing protein
VISQAGADARDLRLAELEREVCALRAAAAASERRMASAAEQLAATDEHTDLIGRVIDSVETLVLILDMDGRILLFNHACEEVSGLVASEVAGRFIWDLFAIAGMEEHARLAFEGMTSGVLLPELERISIERDGVRHYIHWSSNVLERSPGLPPCVVLTGVDITKRHLAERALKSQVKFEQLVARLSRRFIGLTSDNVNDGVQEALTALGEFIQVQSASIWLLDVDGARITRRFRWTTFDTPESEHPALSRELSEAESSSLTARVLEGEPMTISSVAQLPPEAREYVSWASDAPVQAFASVALACGGKPIGFLSLGSTGEREWSADTLQLIKMVTEMIAGTLDRTGSVQALRDSEARMRAVVENMPFMMCALAQVPDFSQARPQLDFVVWNPECERVSGYGATEIVGNPRAHELISPNLDHYQSAVREWETMGNYFRDQAWPLRTKDGTVRTVAWSNLSGRFPIPGWGSWGVGVDVTEQVEAHAALERAHAELEQRVATRTAELVSANKRLRQEIGARQLVEDQLLQQTRILRAILDSIGDGVAVADAAGHFLLFNKAAERILGNGAVDAPPQDWPSIYGLYMPDKTTPYPHTQLPLVRAIRGESTVDVPLYLDRAGGPSGVWLSISGCPLKDETGKLRGGVAVFRDITERRLAHEQLQAEQRLLQQMLLAHERDRQLLAYEIHDGFVQDVTGARLHLEAYYQQRERNPARADEEFQRVLRLLRTTIDDARRAISGLRPPILDEQGIVAAIEYLINEQTGAGPLQVEFRHRIDAKHMNSLLEGTIYRMVQEALNNIRRHSGAERAEVTLTQEGHRLSLEVRDYGAGFDASQVVENRFGLEGIRERARLLRGKARVESVPGKGTRVFVELPVTYPLRQGIRKTEA